MKKIIVLLVILSGIFFTPVFAALWPIDQNIIDEWWTPSTQTTTSNILWLNKKDLRSGNVDMNTIPQVIVSVIQTLLAIAGTVAIFSLIYHAVQMQINSGITGDSSGVDKAKKWMQWALIGFVIAIAAWFLVTRAVDLLSAVS